MQKQKIKVIQKIFRNNSQTAKVVETIELKQEGHNHEAGLYKCSNCNELFSLRLEVLIYGTKKLEEIMDNKNCPTCCQPLKTGLTKIKKHLNPQIKLDAAEWKRVAENEDIFSVIDCYDLDS